MNPWPFVAAAYAVTLAGAGLCGLWSFAAMRRAERGQRRDAPR